ncbi:proline-rich protein PRCC [Osmia bicornis bicornis]|uniref:proline-rich protein PRCC n=1 Tax=Osmia bicornis bicornis TaxID=1437191 RepID=UPI0010F6ACD5|nr:proline-rich protein PRCC [Osmia bicornis bicornis]
MSLVAYGSSDENSDEEENNSGTGDKNKVLAEIVTTQKTTDKLCLPVPKHSEKVDENNVNTGSLEKIHFDKLPKPKSIISETEDIIEEDDIPLKKEIELKPEKPMKKDRVPVKITVPSLSDFQDVDEENETKSNRIKPSNKGTKLFALLPPPKGAEVKNTNKLVPTTVSKTAAKISQEKVQTNKKIKDDSHTNKVSKTTATTTRVSMDISSDEDEDDAVVNSKSSTVTDFFALSATEIVSNPDVSESFESIADLKPESSKIDSEMIQDSEEACSQDNQKTLASVEYDILSLPREEILLKNKAEVGPKLPVPEQEYNIDTEGNVAFDDKAIEYLCGRRGVKRKPKEIKDVNIIEINGEDIKPDEREWLVKALTEEPVQRPVSMQGGVNSQSKKKHQITYLAHQAKAMEMELKNQWAQNRLTRKQTQSKYGF